MDTLDDMGVSKLSAKVFFFVFFLKVNYPFNALPMKAVRETELFFCIYLCLLYS